MALLEFVSRRLDPQVYKAHQAWVRAGCKGPGRLVAEDERLLRIVVSAHSLKGAQFKRCAMNEGNLSHSHLVASLFLSCNLTHVKLYMTTFESTSLQKCLFVDTYLALATFSNAEVAGCDFSGAVAPRVWWRGSTVEESSFQGANLVDAHIERTRFVDCDFREVDFRRKMGGPSLGTTHQTRFEHCDFRGADFEGRKMEETVFEDCRFHGATGIPKFGKGVSAERIDMSALGDGSAILPGETFLQHWAAGTLDEYVLR